MLVKKEISAVELTQATWQTSKNEGAVGQLHTRKRKLHQAAALDAKGMMLTPYERNSAGS